ncbi:3-hydroxybutyrate dehydrogenase [Psychrobacillus sp. FJAT-21963]|uniref:3-hydroxybutyrate dehydrogenase n=1 Tax=Psychrobacillus sp. FJAT-21963 TaxID=1712028 RepID=UPI0006FD6CBD|nr:3-hydroxybutyrate dehydrogenase [Psychrobacillus sp. FJAT-21963]KQL37301.1 3-hydroxybutyrate dehydrogenase [Psychrobacillus sp. FJAT-21963]
MSKQRVVIVTGGAGGMGYAIAQKFVTQNDFVYVADLNQEAAEKVAKELGENTKGIALDVTNEENVQAVIQAIVEEKGSVDVLINNAGLQYRSALEEFPLDKWNLLINVMLTGVFLMTKHVFPYMKKNQFGRIVNISSIHGRLASPEKVAYVAAKHGVIGVTSVTALEGAPFNITANSILPGPVLTPLLERQLNDLKSVGKTEQEALETIMYPRQAMKRFISPEEVASGVAYLAANEASGITGEHLSVSGGM